MVSFDTVQPGDEILVSHINQFGGWLNGDDSSWYAYAAPIANDADNYLLTLRNLGLGGKAFRILSSSGTELLSVSDAGVSVSLTGDQPYYNITDFGAVADANQGGPGSSYTGTDNASAIEAAIAAAKASATVKRVYIPAGFYCHGPIDATDAHEVEIFGDGIGLSVLIPLPSCSNVHAFDIEGSGGLVIKDLGFGRAAFPPDAYGRPTSVVHWGVGSATGNACRFERVSIYGRTNTASFHNESGVSSYFDNCFFYTYGPGAALTMSSATDITFQHCEIHELEAFLNDPDGLTPWTGTSTSQNIALANCGDIQFIGGNMGGNGTRVLYLDGTNENITLIGVELYAQDPVGVSPNHMIFNNGTVDGLLVLNCRFDAGSHIYGGASGCTYKHVVSRSHKTAGAATAMIAMNGASTWQDCDVECNSYSVDVNGGGSGTLTRCRFWNVGSLTAATQTGVVWTDSNGKLTSTNDLKAKRYIANGVATTLSSGNFALGTWGTGATVSSVARNEVAGRFTITAGSGPGANPLVTYTYPGGAYTSAPEVLCFLVGGTGAGSLHQINSSPGVSTCTLQMFHTPTNGLTYTYQLMVMG